jgi:4-carboxymuconolactone decarboxylase
MTPTVPLRDLDAEQQRQLDRFRAEASNLYRALANRPPLLRAWVDFAWTLRQQAVTPRALRELMILRCAQLTGAGYQWADHVVMARAAGVDEERIDALGAWRSSDAFDEQQRTVLAFTDEVVAGAVRDATLAALRERFAPDELVELTLTASFYVMVPRVLDALRVPHGGAAG